MPTMVDLPTIVKDAVDVFGALCAHEPARRHFAAYLPGLRVAAKQTVSGIHGACVVTTEPACLHRWRNEVTGDVQARNDRRLAWWQREPKPRDRPRGVMAIENTLGEPAGKLRADVGWLWDHAHERYGIAQDALLSTAVCPAGAPSPLAWRRFKQTDACQQGECTEHPAWCMELSNEASARDLPGAGTLDSACTRAKVLQHLQSTTRASVGARKRNRPLVEDGREPARQAVARQMPWQAQNPVRVGHRRYWDCRRQRRLLAVPHPVRLVLWWQARDHAAASKALGSHRRWWEGRRMGWVYRHRWPGTETFQRDGQQAWGLGECQVRHGEGQTRHVALVSAAYSLLRRSLHQSRPQDWARTLLTTIGAACRAVTGALLEQLVDWIVDKRADDHWAIPQIKAVLAQT